MKPSPFGTAMGRVALAARALAGTVTPDDIVKADRPEPGPGKPKGRHRLPFTARYAGWDNGGIYPAHSERPRPKRMTEADYRAIAAAEDKRKRRSVRRRGWTMSRQRT